MTQPFLHAKLENTHSHSRKLLYATMARRLDIPLFHFAQQAMRAAEKCALRVNETVSVRVQWPVAVVRIRVQVARNTSYRLVL